MFLVSYVCMYQLTGGLCASQLQLARQRHQKPGDTLLPILHVTSGILLNSVFFEQPQLCHCSVGDLRHKEIIKGAI